MARCARCPVHSRTRRVGITVVGAEKRVGGVVIPNTPGGGVVEGKTAVGTRSLSRHGVPPVLALARVRRLFVRCLFPPLALDPAVLLAATTARLLPLGSDVGLALRAVELSILMSFGRRSMKRR